MAKAILEYDLNDPDDSMAHMRAVKSLDMALVLWEMAYNTKKNLYSQIESKNIEDPCEVVDMVMEKLFEELNEHGINLDQLIV
jgi:hypothetical protein